MPVTSKFLYEANDGSLWPSEGEAKHQNGILALRNSLKSDTFTKEDVLKYFADWYITFIEGQNS